MDMWHSASSIDAVIVIAIKSRWMCILPLRQLSHAFFAVWAPAPSFWDGADRQRALQRRSMAGFSGLAWSGTRGSGRGGSYYRFLDLPLNASIAQADGCVLATASLTDDCMRRIHTILIMDARRAGNAGCVKFCVCLHQKSRVRGFDQPEGSEGSGHRTTVRSIPAH